MTETFTLIKGSLYKDENDEWVEEEEPIEVVFESESKLKITNPRFVERDRYPYLELEINDVPVVIYEPKPILLFEGIVYVGEEVGLPPIEFESQELKGCVRDPKLFQLVVKYVKSINELDGEVFRSGPVEL